MQRKKIPIKFQECMDNVEDGFKIDTGKIYIYIYICSFCLSYVSIVYLFAQCLKNDFVLNGMQKLNRFA